MVCGLCAAHADVPHLIAYQGRLTDSQGTPREGSYSVTFRIYNAESGGTLRWQETHSNVTVTSGIFDILLGSVSPINLPFNEQYYLAIQVGSDAEMTPRQQIASAGYAFKAEKAEEATEAINADTVDGIHASSTPEANKLFVLDENGTLPISVFPVCTAGDIPQVLADKEYVGAGGFMKLKEIVIPRAGTLRIKFDIKSDVDHGANAQVYRNGSPVSTLRYATPKNQWITYSQDISGWQAGDKCQLYGGHTNHGVASIRNFRLYSAIPVAPVVTLDVGE